MNKNAIKKFAIEARKKLIASVSDRAGMLGITEEGCSEPISKGIDFEVYKTVAGTEVTLGRTQCEQRRKLKEQIEARGFEAVVEEVAYTWFNRICAIRFMEVNDYLPTRVRVLSSEKEGKNEPDIVTQAPDVDLDFTDKEREYILDCKMNNKLDELFKMLFVKQCNKLSEILPELFEATEDYTEMLLNISYTNKDDIIHMLVNQETGIPETDFNVSSIGEDGQPTGQVEIIGWLYQYYNTELKDDTFTQLKKNVKISKERIPAATQLFTPDWIVRYMVENSVGRLWIEHLRAVDPTVNEKEVAERFGWKYYLPEAEQKADVNIKLAEIRTSYKDLKPEDITCIDPCMGSGHILVAMFDVLMDIYKSAGYSERDAAFEIVEHNIHGLDIDKRAYQLSYFAIMMKGRGYNRRFFRGKDDIIPCPKVYAIQESNTVNRVHLKYFGMSLNDMDRRTAMNQMNSLLDSMFDAREYGSILRVETFDWSLLRRFIAKSSEDEQLNFETIGIEITQESLLKLVTISELMANKYWVYCTNPPYMGLTNCNAKLSAYIKKNYPDSKSDLCVVFIDKAFDAVKTQGYISMITQLAWMFLSSFEEIRRTILKHSIVNMCHLGARAFEEIGGEVVQTTAFIVNNGYIRNYEGVYERLVQYTSQDEKEYAFLGHENGYKFNQDALKGVPGSPIAYWINKNMIDTFGSNSIGDYSYGRQGMTTTDNAKYLRLWFELDFSDIAFGMQSREQSVESGKKWFPYNKGGSYRKWYGNNDYVVYYYNDGQELIDLVTKKYPKISDPEFIIKNRNCYFREGIEWSDLTTGTFGARRVAGGYIFDACSPTAFITGDVSEKTMLGFMNSTVFQQYVDLLCPGLHYNICDVMKVPVLIEKNQEIDELVDDCILLSKEDWDSFERSWDYKKHPLVGNFDTVKDAYDAWIQETEERYERIRANENRINEIVIAEYNMRKNVDSMVKDDDISVCRANLSREIKSLISYAVGCMMGRYSLDFDGLQCTGGDWSSEKYITYTPDKDGIIPITDEEYLDDDIVGLFVNWVKCVYGEEHLEDNLEFISEALGNKGNTAREIIRNYFLMDFYKDHASTYSTSGSGKRPIYWLFDSGKADGFKALIYMNRYDVDIVGKVRVDYLHKVQKLIEQAKVSAEYLRDNGSGTEKAKATKLITKYTKQLAEINLYDEAMAHIANQRIELDLDDGVKVNYAKFQGVEVAQEGKKTLKIDLLAKI